MIGSIKSILFDLDGTLTDPKEGIINSILYSLGKLGISEVKTHELDTFIGPPLLDSFAQRYNLTDGIAERAVSYYREYYSEKGIFENKLYFGVIELMEYLSSRNYQLFVATSKPTLYATEVLRHFKLDNYFKDTIGSNLDNTRSDKTEIIAHIISAYGLRANLSVMIGDRKHDITGAKNNLMNTIGVTYGYGSLEELELCKPDFITNSCREIKALFENNSFGMSK